MPDHDLPDKINDSELLAKESPLVDANSDLDVLDDEVEPAIYSDSSISQQTIRSSVEGCDFLSVTARIVVPEGDDRQVLHIPIQPAFFTVPEVEAFVVSGQELRIRVTHRQKFGIRLELILAEQSSLETESVIEVILKAKEKESACQSRREAA